MRWEKFCYQHQEIVSIAVIKMRTVGKGWASLHLRSTDLQSRVTTPKQFEESGQYSMLTPKMGSVWDTGVWAALKICQEEQWHINNIHSWVSVLRYMPWHCSVCCHKLCLWDLVTLWIRWCLYHCNVLNAAFEKYSLLNIVAGEKTKEAVAS